MAQSTDNVVTYGLRGMIGKLLVFKKRGDKMIVSNRPVFKASRTYTPEQIQVQQRFKEASIYASAAIKDEVLKLGYTAMATGNQSGFNRAFLDYQTPPTFLGNANITAYTGSIGDKLVAKVTDDFKVDEVKVEIRSADDTIIEAGQAVMQPNGLDWEYTIKVFNGNLAGTKIILMAYDLPRNETIQEITI